MELTFHHIVIFAAVNVVLLFFLYFFIAYIYKMTHGKKKDSDLGDAAIEQKIKKKVQENIHKVLTEEIKKKTQEIEDKMRAEYEEKIQQQEQKVVELNKKYYEVKENNARLIVQKKKTENVIHSQAAGVIVVNDKGETIMMNPAAEKIIGKKQKEVLGKPVIQSKGEGKMISIADKDDEGKVIVSKDDDDSDKTIKSSSAVIENEQGQTVGMVSVPSDITKQKELEATKTRFVASVSHELRTPLTAIQRSLEIIADGQLGNVSEKQREFLGLSLTSIQRLRKLVNDILDFSKMDSGRMDLDCDWFEIKSLVKDVKDAFQVLVQDKEVGLKVEIADGNVKLEADRNRLIQVLTNLIANALKYTPSGGTITIKVSLVKDNVGENQEILFEVMDTGKGISEEDQKKIFEQFSQGSQHTDEKFRGTGLGLSIAKQIVELHGGSIGVKSVVDKGSTFHFQIPLHQQLN